MKDEDIKKEGLRSIEEFEKAWNEFFKGKSEPKSEEEDRKQQEEFYQWYNYVRKQSDTGKTPAEMYREIYGKEAPKNLPIDSTEQSRMMNFNWDEDYTEEEDEEDERILKEVSEIADEMFEEGVWQSSKEELKEMSRKDSSKHMFRLGFFMYAKFVDEQVKTLAKKLQGKSEEEIKEIIENMDKEDNSLK